MNKASEYTAIAKLQARLRGEVIRPEDEHYDQARRVWNGRIDKYPALIVRCADLTDVLTAIAFARHENLAVAVRSGGHSIIGLSMCDGGLVIDLSRKAERHMQWVRAFQAAILPFAESGVYTNFLGDEEGEHVRASYGVNYERLVALKNRYDPTNFFHLNENIKPTL